MRAVSQKPSVRGWSVYPKIAFAVAGAFSFWLTVAVTAGGVLGAKAPRQISAIAPFDARLKGRAAFLLLERDQKATTLARAEKLAKEAIAREPINIDAIRALGIISTLRQPHALDRSLALFLYSNTLSRRDLATQLWLIEYNAQSGTISGALRHFDNALRTSRSASQMLFPVLISASNDPAISKPLNNLLRHRPFWWKSFVPVLLSTSNSPETITRLLRNLLDINSEDERALLRQAMERLVTHDRPDLAWDVFENATTRGGSVARRGQVYEGGFDGQGDLPPFGWVLAEEPDLNAVRESSGGNDSEVVLRISSQNGRGGEVARQLLLLQPGNYRLSAIAGNTVNIGSDLPMVTMTCHKELKPILNLPFSKANGAGETFSGSFQVPQGCRAQWLRIELPSLSTIDGAWVDSIAIAGI